MKKNLLFLLLVLFIGFSAFSQTQVYSTSGGEMIFSFATIDNDGDESGNIMRWSPVFNPQVMLNFDLNEHVGFFTGFAVRNVGHIYKNYRIVEDDKEIMVKKKFRTYNAGVPVGIKIGNLKKGFLYGGYDLELPFHYKEKTFRDEKKDKFSAWFSNRVEQFQHALIVGIQFPYGANLKFKYYFSSFHNQSYTESNGNKPYENLNVNIFYFSLNFNLFKNDKFYYSKEGSKEYY